MNSAIVAEKVGPTAGAIHEEKYVVVAAGHEELRSGLVDSYGNTGAMGKGYIVDKPANRVAGGRQSLALQAEAKPSSNASIYPDSPQHLFDHGEGTLGAKVIGARSVARAHHPRIQEHRHVEAGEFAIKETGGSAGEAGGGLENWCGSANEKDVTVVGGMKAAFATKDCDFGDVESRGPGKGLHNGKRKWGQTT